MIGYVRDKARGPFLAVETSPSLVSGTSHATKVSSISSLRGSRPGTKSS